MTKKPDFIIPGAMKAGTSSLHHILSESDQVFMPDKELSFFNCDDFRSKGVSKDFEPYENRTEEEYLNKFNSGSESDQVFGERSTTYMASKLAPQRLYDFNSDLKFVFMLRDPVDRAYSNYKHSVRSGRNYFSFEESLANNFRPIVERSLYKQQIENYLDYFPRGQLKFVIFERFIENQQEVISEVCEFLGIDDFDISDIESHKNKSPGYRSLEFQLFLNFANSRGFSTALLERLNESYNKQFGKINQHSEDLLTEVLKQENKNLEEVIGRDVSEYWKI